MILLSIIYIQVWTIVTLCAFLLILTTYNNLNLNQAFSNPFKNARRKKQAEADLKEYLIKWKVMPELWSVKSVTAKPTNPYQETNWDFYIEFKFLDDGKDYTQVWATHINNISRFDLTIEPSKHIFSIRRQFRDTFITLTSVANKYAEVRNTTVEDLKKQFKRDQKLKQLGL
jgi:hypothetical protein